MDARILVSLVAAVSMAAFATRASAAEPVVARVLVVQTADVAAYAKEVAVVAGMMNKLGVKATIRVWQARFAGEQAGSVVVAAEYANLAALAKADDLGRNNAEFSAELKKVMAMRKMVSDSLYTEVTP